MITQPVIDLDFVKAVLAEYTITGPVQAIRGGECRLECAAEYAAKYRRLLLERLRFEVISINAHPNKITAVLWFRVKGMTV